jgi:hypothetical protein
LQIQRNNPGIYFYLPPKPYDSLKRIKMIRISFPASCSMLHARGGNFIPLIFGIAISAVFAATAPTGHVTYTLGTENGTTSDGQQAYARIKIAMDSAMYYYNTYTHITK